MPHFNRLGGDMDEANAECAAMDQEDADRKETAHMKTLIEAVKNHAKANYEVGGWDMVVECYEDAEIGEAIAGCATVEEAIAEVGKTASLYHERRQEAWSEGGLDKNGRSVEDNDMLYAEEEAAHIAAEHQGVSYLNTDELTGYEEHCRDEESTYGDPRRCPRHPHVTIGSPCGMFDGVCGECEYGMEMEDEEFQGTVPAVVVSVAPTGVEVVDCCKEPKVLGGKCENCGTWSDDIPF
mgnify:CR=1 FL=1